MKMVMVCSAIILGFASSASSGPLFQVDMTRVRGAAEKEIKKEKYRDFVQSFSINISYLPLWAVQSTILRGIRWLYPFRVLRGFA